MGKVTRNTKRRNTTRRNTTRRNTKRRNTTRRNTKRRNTKRSNTKRSNTKRRKKKNNNIGREGGMASARSRLENIKNALSSNHEEEGRMTPAQLKQFTQVQAAHNEHIHNSVVLGKKQCGTTEDGDCYEAWLRKTHEGDWSNEFVSEGDDRRDNKHYHDLWDSATETTKTQKKYTNPDNTMKECLPECSWLQLHTKQN